MPGRPASTIPPAQWPQVEQDPPAQSEHEGVFVPATLFPPLCALNSESLRRVRRLPHEAQAAASSARFIGRSSSNSRRQASHTYS
jgi:hypothetical protein